MPISYRRLPRWELLRKFETSVFISPNLVQNKRCGLHGSPSMWHRLWRFCSDKVKHMMSLVSQPLKFVQCTYCMVTYVNSFVKGASFSGCALHVSCETNSTHSLRQIFHFAASLDEDEEFFSEGFRCGPFPCLGQLFSWPQSYHLFRRSPIF